MDTKDHDSQAQMGSIVPSRTGSAQEVGLKITSAQREYYRYTEVSAEAQRHGFLRYPPPDFTRLPSRGLNQETGSLE